MPQSERGVWLDAGVGPNGELAIVVIDSHHHRLLSGAIPHGMDRIRFTDALWGFLDTVDPSSAAMVRAPVSRRIRRYPRALPIGWEIARSTG